jgi:transcriptional regulator with XRE-family HTH domain
VSGGVPLDGERVRQLREGRVLSRRELADKAGVGYSTLADLETGFFTRNRPQTIRALASVLRVKPESLVGRPKRA